MKAKLPLIARILLGLIFFIFGIAGLFNLMPPPPNMPEKLMTFMSGLMATTYFFPLLKITEIVCGALLLLGMFVPLALVVLAPIVINIFMVHAFMEPSGLPMAIAIVILMIYLSFFAKPYSVKIKQLFQK
ncbi:MAG: DoxX family protein [Bdellovibrionales bacterium]|nr:DoxX family protein [Bdellovibrionales bacterium]